MEFPPIALACYLPARCRARVSARLASSFTRPFLYSTGPRKSALGSASSAASCAACAMLPSSSFLPRRKSSAFLAFTDVGQTDSYLLTSAFIVQSQLDGYGGRGEIPDLALQFQIDASAAGRRNRNANFGEDFIVLQCGAEQREEEFLNGYNSRLSLPSQPLA